MRAARAVDILVASVGVAKPIAFVSGFWRSGTTWMQELLADILRAKTVFEPLCAQNPIWQRHLIARGLSDLAYQEAFIPGRTEDNHLMWSYLDAAFLATVGSHASVQCRGTVRESFRRAIIVKDVRLQLNLETVHRRYGVPVIHMRRHPCAVVSSLASAVATWSWDFDDVRLASLFAPFIDDLHGEDRERAETAVEFDADAVSRIAAYWAITEHLVDRTLRNRPWAAIVAYEDAVRDPAGTATALCKLIGRRPSRAGNPNVDSVTTDGSSRGVHPRSRPHLWRSRLSIADIDQVYRVVDAIFPEALADLRDKVT